MSQQRALDFGFLERMHDFYLRRASNKNIQTLI